MTIVSIKQEFCLHFEGENEFVRHHELPASALIQAVQALQRIVHLLAHNYEGLEIKQRLRLSRDMEGKYPVVLGVPKQGGYMLPYSVGNPLFELLAPQDIEAVLRQHNDVLAAIESNDENAFKRAVPVAQVRKLIISELKKMQPPKHTGLYVSVETKLGDTLLNGRNVADRLEPILPKEMPPSIHPQNVTGRLDGLEFQTRTLKLQLPNGRSLQGFYGDDFEPILLENPREFIQVRGEAILNDDGSLKSLNNISEIIEIVTEPLEIAGFELKTDYFAAKSPLSFAVTFDPEDSLYTASGDYHILVSGENRDELAKEVGDALAFLWNEYVETEVTNLTKDAIALRDKLLTSFGAQ